jgi:hypothetical protein
VCTLEKGLKQGIQLTVKTSEAELNDIDTCSDFSFGFRDLGIKVLGFRL